MAQASQRIGILHLSDVQFGPNHRFTQGVDSLAARLIPALQALPDEALPIDLVVFSGDAAEHGLPDQFDGAARFLTAVLEAFELDPDRLVIVPGNHDISRDAVKAQIFAARAEGAEAQPPFERKWDNYRGFLRTLRGEGGSDAVSEVRRFPQLGLTVSALNSTVAETAEEHYGLCGEEQLEEHARALIEHPDDLRVAVVHHNVRQAAPDDAENLRDEQDLVRVLGAHVDLVLHGHRHAAGRDYLSNGRLILSTGSAALRREQRPDETPNQFQIVGLSRTQVERWAFSFDPKDKRWVVDATLGQDGIAGYESIALPGSGAAVVPTPRRPAAADPRSAPPPAVGDPLAALDDEAQIDEEVVARFRADLRDDADGLRDGALTPMELLGRMGLLRGGAMTVGAALLFGRQPQRELPAAIVQCVRYLGEDVAAERESIRVEGTARAQVDGALRFLRERITRRERPGTETARAEVTYAYPMACLREVIVNAIVHRDYADAGRNVHVRLFSDRIEVASPGAWCTERTLDDGKPLADAASQSVKRNPRLAHAMALIRYFEGEGSGIPTAVRDAAVMRATPPTVRKEDGFVVVTVFPAQLDAGVVDALLDRARREPDGNPLVPSRLRRAPSPIYVPQRIAPSTGTGRVLDAGELLMVPERRILLVGAPGGGKTTLLSHLARELARTESALPIVVAARDLADVPGGDVAELVHRLWRREASRELSVDAIRRTIEHSPTVLLIDGLDEVGHAALQSRVIDDITAAGGRFPRMRAIVATRSSVVPTAARDWETFMLLPWSDAEIVRYLQAMGTAVGLDALAGDRLVERVSGDPRLLTLAQVPLLGAAIAGVYGAFGRVPTSRFELLRAATELIVERWDLQRGLASEIDTRLQRDVLRLLALNSLRSGMDVGGLPWDWCRAQVRSIADYAAIAPDDLLRSVTERGSLLVRAPDGMLAFRVLALAELLAAEELERSAGDDELFEVVIDAAEEPRMRAVAELALLSRQSHSHLVTSVPELLDHASRRSTRQQLVALDLAASMISEGDDDPRAAAAFVAFASRLRRDGAPFERSALVERVHAQLTRVSPD